MTKKKAAEAAKTDTPEQDTIGADEAFDTVKGAEAPEPTPEPTEAPEPTPEPTEAPEPTSEPVGAGDTGVSYDDEAIEQRITGVEYTRVEKGNTTQCVITLDNGYTVFGETPSTANESEDQIAACKAAFKKLRDQFNFLACEHNFTA